MQLVPLPVHALRFAGGVDEYPRAYNKPLAVRVACAVVGEGPLPKHFVTIYERTGLDMVVSTHN